MIYRIIGFLLLIETIMLLCCGGVSLLYHEDDLISFLQSAGLTVLMGALLLFIGRGAEKQLGRRDGYVIVTVAWLAFSLFGMFPFYLSGYIPSVTDAFFETMSGFSSTGATILDDKVHPRIGVTAKWIWGIYAGMTGALIILLMLGGMDVFDSICHAFTTTGTGGFSTKQASIEYYHSPYIEYVISIFMFVSGINFTLLLLFINGKLKKVVHDAELKWYFWSVTSFTVVIAVILYYSSSMAPEEAFRKSLFQVASLHTSTGFATADYMTWPAITWGLLTVTMIMGACAGSTTGGLKSIRLVILAKISRNEFKHIIHPNAVLPVRINKQVISPSIRSTVLAFTFLYAVLIIIGTLAMLGLGVGLTESLGCAISSLGNMGPGLGSCGPAHSWSGLPDAAKWLMSFFMLLGRLELFTVLLLFSSDFWKRN